MDEQKKQEKFTIAKEALQAMTELEEMHKLEEIIKDNKITFAVEGKDYRVRKLTLPEQRELADFKRKKYLGMVSDESFLFRKQWIERYKAKGIDIDKMQTTIQEREQQVKDLLLRLAQTKDPKNIEKLKKEVLKLRDEQFSALIEKTDLLGYSIEDQLTLQTRAYTVYLILERLEGDNWVKHFNTYEDYEKSEDTPLLNQAIYYMNYLVYGGENEYQTA